MNDKANIVPVAGHRGPHPEAYHRQVFETLRDAVASQRSKHDKRVALIAKLNELAALIRTPGTDLNKLVTQGYCDPPD
jgi:hypothetical protein